LPEQIPEILRHAVFFIQTNYHHPLGGLTIFQHPAEEVSVRALAIPLQTGTQKITI
jgi:hypothetical protein